MLHQSTALAQELFRSFDIGAVATDLLEGARRAPKGRAACSLFESDKSTIVAMALRRGERMSRYSASGPVVIVPLIGHVTFASSASHNAASVVDPMFLEMGPRVRHELAAIQDAAFLLILGR